MNLEFQQPFEQPAVGERPYITAEQFEIRSVSVPQLTVQPGAEVRVSTEYGSDFGFVPTPFDIDTEHPDYCTFGGLGFTPGADLYLEVVGGTTDTTEGACWDVSNNSSAVETAIVAAPTRPGAHTIEVRMIGRETRRTYDTAEIEIQVSENADPIPVEPDPGDGDNGGNGDNGDNGGFDGIPIDLPGNGNPFVDPAEIGVVVLTILLLLFIAVALR